MSFIRNILTIVLCYTQVFIITLVNYPIALFANRLTLMKTLSKSFDMVRATICIVMGLKIEYRGLENIPDEVCIFASKHQSFFESTFFFNQFKLKTVYAYKKEVNNIPLWGRFSKKFGGVAVDRALSTKTIRNVISQSQEYIKDGYSLCIFPEGTRVPVDKEVSFKRSIYQIHTTTQAPIVPVAINTGCFYPKGKLFLSKQFKQAKIIIEFLPVITYEDSQKFKEKEFMIHLQSVVNNKSSDLAKEVL